jgi:hypothetical protein
MNLGTIRFLISEVVTLFGVAVFSMKEKAEIYTVHVIHFFFVYRRNYHFMILLQITVQSLLYDRISY